MVLQRFRNDSAKFSNNVIFIFTNADINSNLLKTLLKRAVANSFNAITVDSDQSTNDMVSIFSTRAIKIGQNIIFK